MTDTPFVHHAPKTSIANMRWRSRIRKDALNDPDLQATIRQACFKDPLFFFQFAMWVIEPRGEQKILPFCLWPHQIPAILSLVKSIEDTSAGLEDPIDVVFDKSRAQGATWICLGVILWYWLKEPMFSAGIISRNIEAVDKRNYPGSLFPKLDWAISMLPYWLRPGDFIAKRDRSQTDHVWFNRELGGTIVGTACTAEAFSGDRLTVLFYDEAAKVDQDDFQEAMNSTQHVTQTRWIVSTHYGDSGPFYDMVFGDAVGVKVILDWRDNPTQNRLSYSFRDGMVWAVNPDEQKQVADYVKENRSNLDKLRRRGFIKDGRTRSPWYDRKCLQKGATPRGIAQDLDRDPRSTVGKLFSPEVLDEMDKKHIRPPVWQGDVVVNDGRLKIVPGDEGPLKLWFMPGVDNEPPMGRYVVACDIGTGLTGGDASNSCAQGADALTGEQVMEYVVQLPESRFAYTVTAICEWLGNAFLIWEAQGSCGKRFANAVVHEIGYANIYKRPNVNVGHKVRSEQLGWVNNMPAHKRDLFEDLWIAMDDEEFTPRSAEMIQECRGWEEAENEKIIYHGTGHGDRAIAGGLVWKGIKFLGEIGLDKPKEEAHAYRSNSIFVRREQRLASIRRNDDDDMIGLRPREGAVVREW